MYDCVCVLNTTAAVDAYTKTEVNLGGAVALAAGPLSIPTNTKDVKPVWVYTKSRGLYGGLTVDGTVIKERPDVNTEFYGSKVTSEKILKGEVVPQNSTSGWLVAVSQLIEVLKMAEGKTTDTAMLQGISNEPTPGDLQE